MDHYGKARREGLHIYNSALQAHEDPYLPVLEDNVPELSALSKTSLGILSVPLSRVMARFPTDVPRLLPGISFPFSTAAVSSLPNGTICIPAWSRRA